jgi:putative integral membrane protein (TIGR02587 family)
MNDMLAEEFREQGRGVAGALLALGVSAVYTQEVWEFGGTLPLSYLLGYTVAGLSLVYLVSRRIGFREGNEDHPRPFGMGELTDFVEILLQSLVASYLVLFLFGTLRLSDPPVRIARLGLFYLVPFAFGAALANTVLSDEGPDHRDGTASSDQSSAKSSADEGFGVEGGVALGRESLFQQLGVYAFGAFFFAYPIAPTEEVKIIATGMGWSRLLVVLTVSLLTTYLVLYLLEFRGQGKRSRGHSRRWRIGATCVVYVLCLVVSALLLAGVGAFSQAPPSVRVSQTVVLGFAATLGASGAEVVLG